MKSRDAGILGGLVISILFICFSCSFAQDSQFSEKDEKEFEAVGKLQAMAMHCQQDYKPYFSKYMEVQKRLYPYSQTVFIGAYIGAAAGYYLTDSTNIDCESVKHQLLQKTAELNRLKFTGDNLKKEELIWYDLGQSGKEDVFITFPVGDFSHSVLMIYVTSGKADSLFIDRFPGDSELEKFDKENWEKSKNANRIRMAMDVVNSGMIEGKSRSEIADFLGKPDGVFSHEYGYEIVK